MLKIYIFTHSGGAEVALGEIPETVSGLGDFIYCVTEVTDHFVPLLLFRVEFYSNAMLYQQSSFCFVYLIGE